MSWTKVIVLVVGLAFAAVLAPLSASAATHYLSQTKTVSKAYHGWNRFGTVYCQHGWHVTGGGVDVTDSQLAPAEDHPNADAAHDQGWAAYVVGPTTVSGDPSPGFTVYAVCAN